MKKHFYIGLVFTGLIATCGVAQASEHTPVVQAQYMPQAAQPYNVAYKVERQTLQRKRVVRVIKAEAPRARLVNGTYRFPTTKTSQPRRIVTQPTRTIPNLYASVVTSSTPVLFDQKALQAR